MPTLEANRPVPPSDLPADRGRRIVILTPMLAICGDCGAVSGLFDDSMLSRLQDCAAEHGLEIKSKAIDRAADRAPHGVPIALRQENLE